MFSNHRIALFSSLILFLLPSSYGQDDPLPSRRLNYTWNIPERKWELSYQEVYTYRTDGQILSLFGQDWDRENNSWKTVTLFTSDYDYLGNRVYRERYEMDWDGDSLYLSNIDRREFDENGCILVWRREFRPAVGEEMTPRFQYSYQRDEACRPLEEKLEFVSGGILSNNSRIQYEYEDNGLTTITRTASWDGSDWIPGRYIKSTVTETGQLKEQETRVPEDSPTSRSFFQLAPDGLSSKRISETWDGQQWLLTGEEDITYNELGKATLEVDIRYFQNPDTLFVNTESRTESSYDAFGNVLWRERFFRYWDNSDLAYVTFSSRSADMSYKYTCNNIVTERVGVNQGFPSFRTIYGYQGTDSAPCEPAVKPLGMKLFPSPATDYVIIRSNIFSGGPTTLNVTDLSGRNYFRQENVNGTEVVVELEDFPRGIYIVHLQNQNGQVQRKLMKQ
ncbi:MAG: T9SS type A sorting domain-containing protein [Bacteroidota bacterium]